MLSVSHKETYQAAMKLLMRRMYSIQELHSKLVVKGHSEIAISHVILELSQRGYLDDTALCDILFRKYSSIRKYSIKQIIAKLKLRGLTMETIQSIMNQYEGINEIDAALNLLRKRYLNPQTVDHAKIVRYLLSKGFSYSVIHQATQSISASAPDF